MKKNSFVEGTIIASFAIILTKILGVLYVIPFYSIICIFQMIEMTRKDSMIN